MCNNNKNSKSSSTQCNCGCSLPTAASKKTTAFENITNQVFSSMNESKVVGNPKKPVTKTPKLLSNKKNESASKIGSNKRLLIETFQFSKANGVKILTESNPLGGASSNGVKIVRGPIQRAEAVNQNGRVYSRKVLERAIANYQKLIDEKRAFGELDHPDSMVVELKNTSHNIKKIWWEGNDVMADIEILPTPSGLILHTLLDCGMTVGISSRGMGSTESISESVEKVAEDFEILCWDFVSDPSTHGAFTKEVKSESRKPKAANTTDNSTDLHKWKRMMERLDHMTCTLTGKCVIN